MAETEDILYEGLDVFSRWKIPRPCVIRTGSLLVGRKVYKAINKVGLPYSSNIGVGIYKPDEQELNQYSGYIKIDNVFEIPILSHQEFYSLFNKKLMVLTITGSSWQEIKYLLIEANKQKIDYVIIFTHLFEYVNPCTRQKFLFPCRMGSTAWMPPVGWVIATRQPITQRHNDGFTLPLQPILPFCVVYRVRK